jgi:hypothetical protein
MTHQDPLSAAIADILKRCEANGMKPPFIVCSAAPNGSVLVVRMSENSDPDVLAEHYEPSGFALPMTIMVLDQDNVAVRVALEATGEATWH